MSAFLRWTTRPSAKTELSLLNSQNLAGTFSHGSVLYLPSPGQKFVQLVTVQRQSIFELSPLSLVNQLQLHCTTHHTLLRVKSKSLIFCTCSLRVYSVHSVTAPWRTFVIHSAAGGRGKIFPRTRANATLVELQRVLLWWLFVSDQWAISHRPSGALLKWRLRTFLALWHLAVTVTNTQPFVSFFR